MSGRGLALVTDGRRTRTARGDGSGAADHALESGSVLAGKYRLEHELGRGGMGVVYAARHLSLDEPIALKLLSSELAMRQDAVARFLREARACARLRNRHVVRVLDAGTLEDGTPYVAMERLEGTDLGASLRERGRLPITEAVELVLQACEALGEAHARGIVHRDIKPSNLWLLRDGGSIKVLDFGIAKMADPEASFAAAATLTASATVLGSPAYMAPEQIRHASDVDARADVWSLGVVLFELVSGKLPFVGESAPALLAAISADAPLPLRRVLPEAPRALEKLVASCLERDPEKRLRDVAELARRLAPFRSSAAPRRTRRPLFAALAVAAVLAGTAALAWSAPPTPIAARRIARTPPDGERARAVRAEAPPPSAPPATSVAATATAPATAQRRPAAPPPRRESFEDSLEAATAHRK